MLLMKRRFVHKECINKRSYLGENFKSVKIWLISCDEVNGAEE